METSLDIYDYKLASSLPRQLMGIIKVDDWTKFVKDINESLETLSGISAKQRSDGMVLLFSALFTCGLSICFGGSCCYYYRGKNLSKLFDDEVQRLRDKIVTYNSMWFEKKVVLKLAGRKPIGINFST